MNKTEVIAISGTSGCGKTTIVKHLAERFNCPSFHFDDYVEENTYPKDMKKWLTDGANLSEIKTPKLISAIHKLLEHREFEFVFIEEPFGKERESMRSLINYVVLLDQPMEICLARVIMRSINDPNIDSLNLLPMYLVNYQDHYRNCYIEAVKQVRNNCDQTIIDVLSVQETVNLVSKIIMPHYKMELS